VAPLRRLGAKVGSARRFSDRLTRLCEISGARSNQISNRRCNRRLLPVSEQSRRMRKIPAARCYGEREAGVRSDWKNSTVGNYRSPWRGKHLKRLLRDLRGERHDGANLVLAGEHRAPAVPWSCRGTLTHPIVALMSIVSGAAVPSSHCFCFVERIASTSRPTASRTLGHGVAKDR
jgi:hypothetical protein